MIFLASFAFSAYFALIFNLGPRDRSRRAVGGVICLATVSSLTWPEREPEGACPEMANHQSGLLEALLPSMVSRGGAFRLLCSVARCRREDLISDDARPARREHARVAACVKFIGSGWRFREGPMCPDCRRSIGACPASGCKGRRT